MDAHPELAADQNEKHHKYSRDKMPNGLPKLELELNRDLENSQTALSKEQEVPVANGTVSAAPSMQEIPLDSPSLEQPPVVPVKSPTVPVGPRVGTPRSQSFTPRNSTSVASSSRHHRSLTLSKGQTISSVLITTALDTILDSREAKRSTALRDATQRALDMINAENDELIDSRLLFEPLRIACGTRNEKLMVASVDCISKLISYNFFTDTIPPDHGSLPLPDLIVDTITTAAPETASDAVSLQAVKSLLALVLSSSIVVHHSSLLKAIHTIYNVFILSQNSSNQLVAQGGLTQIFHHVFSRCKTSKLSSQSEENLTNERTSPFTPSTTLSPPSPISAAVTAVEETRKNLDDTANTSLDTAIQSSMQTSENVQHEGESVKSVAELSPNPPPDDHATERTLRDLTFEEMFLKDAFIVFRSLCKLAKKQVPPERSDGLRCLKHVLTTSIANMT